MFIYQSCLGYGFKTMFKKKIQLFSGASYWGVLLG